MVARVLRKRKIVKKRTKKFTRHECEDFKNFGPSWRHVRGIDSSTRRRFRGRKPLVNIGYGNNKKTRHCMVNGFKRFLIRNPQDLELLLMNNRVYAGEIAANISARKRAALINRAKELNVNLTNAKAKIVEEEAPALE